jgi:hypothetical protein
MLARSLLEGDEAGRTYGRLAMASAEDSFDRSVGLIWRAKGYLSPAAERLMRQVEAAARRFVLKAR